MATTPSIIIDCDKMKYANTGLFSFCYYLITELNKVAEKYDETIAVFATDKVRQREHVPESVKFISSKTWNKY